MLRHFWRISSTYSPTAENRYNIDVRDRSLIQTGPNVNLPYNLMLRQLIAAHLSSTAAAQRPHLIHIGYSASANSFINCGYFPMSGDSNAGPEAFAILDAANYVESQNIKVLLTLGPGALRAAPTPTMVCMQRAFSIVDNAIMMWRPHKWVDYSGYRAGVGTDGVLARS
jgi:hypothetical protein